MRIFEIIITPPGSGDASDGHDNQQTRSQSQQATGKVKRRLLEDERNVVVSHRRVFPRNERLLSWSELPEGKGSRQGPHHYFDSMPVKLRRSEVMAGLEDVQDGVDSLVLAFFDSVRGHSKDKSSSGASIEHLQEQYQKTMDLIDQLLGGNRTAQEQLNEIEALQSQISEVKGSLSSFEEKLQEIDNQCTSELKSILTDELLTNQERDLRRRSTT
jgi:hypothetical protein